MEIRSSYDKEWRQELLIWYHDRYSCWWPGNARRQVISRHDGPTLHSIFCCLPILNSGETKLVLHSLLSPASFTHFFINQSMITFFKLLNTYLQVRVSSVHVPSLSRVRGGGRCRRPRDSRPGPCPGAIIPRWGPCPARTQEVKVRYAGTMISSQRHGTLKHHTDGSVQERCNSSALAMDLRLSSLTHRYLDWALQCFS